MWSFRHRLGSVAKLVSCSVTKPIIFSRGLRGQVPDLSFIPLVVLIDSASAFSIFHEDVNRSLVSKPAIFSKGIENIGDARH
jgi:hypothetical protein